MLVCYSTQQKLYCVIDTGSTISLLPLKFTGTFNTRIKYIQLAIIGQAKGDLKINKICKIFVKKDHIKKEIRFFIFDINLNYAILGL